MTTVLTIYGIVCGIYLAVGVGYTVAGQAGLWLMLAAGLFWLYCHI